MTLYPYQKAWLKLPPARRAKIERSREEGQRLMVAMGMSGSQISEKHHREAAKFLRSMRLFTAETKH